MIRHAKLYSLPVVCSLLFLAAVAWIGCPPAMAYEAAPGLAVRQITHDGKSYTERGAGCAPQGDLVVFYRDVSKTDRELWLMKLDGSGARAVSPVGWPMLAGWSPDGAKIAYIFANKNESQSEARVCVYDTVTAETKEYEGGYRRGCCYAGGDAPPIWSPDSTHFGYNINDPSRHASFLWIFAAGGAKSVRLGENLDAQATDTQGSWSPDGKQVVFVATAGSNLQPELWRSNIDGTGLSQITHDQKYCAEPKWSPDGQWIVFFSQQGRLPDEIRAGGLWDLLLVRPDGTDEHTIISGSSPASQKRGTYVHPSWAPDQSYIICHGSNRDDSGQGYTAAFWVDWRAGKWQRIMGGVPGSRQFSSGHDWLISPDSQRVFRHGFTSILRGTGDQATTSDGGDELVVYDVPARRATTLLTYRQGKDPVYLYGEGESWTPDSKQILYCQGKVVSWQKEQYEPDLYVLTVPEADAAPAPPTEVTASADVPAVAPPATPAPPAPAPGTPPAPDQSLIRPTYLTADQAVACLPDNLRSACRVEPERNLVIVIGPPEIAAQVKQYLAGIDTPAPQVTMDVLVTEMSKDSSRDLGLDWTYAKGRFGALLPVGDGTDAGQVFYQGVGKLDHKFYVNLNALEEKGDVTIRANPRLVAISGRVASINIRRTKYYFYTSGYNDAGQAITEESDISADIVGKITPRVLGDGHILMDIEVEVGNFTFTGTSTLPDVTSRKAAAGVMVKAGDTVMIGGLVLRQETKSEKRTPLLGDLPVLGQLFRSTHRKVEESVLTIFITPRLGVESAPPTVEPARP